jgi:putative ABC transport system substrate-binding protein
MIDWRELVWKAIQEADVILALIVALGIVLAPLGADGQETGKVWRVGSLHPASAETVAPYVTAFEQGLADLGHTKGRTTTIEYRFLSPARDKLREAAAELSHKVDVLVVWGTVVAMAAKDAGVQIPLVLAPVGDPVAIGLARSLSHPGGNATGLTFEAASETYGKRLQLLKEVTPGLLRVATLGAADDANVIPSLESVQRVAPSLGLQIHDVRVRSASELEGAFADMTKKKAQAVLVVAGSFTYVNRSRIVALAVAHGLPSVHGFKESVVAGGLISLGPDLVVIARQAAGYVDKILRGARPGDLPIAQPARYEMFVNLRTAKALGLAIPPSILLRADQVIE